MDLYFLGRFRGGCVLCWSDVVGRKVEMEGLCFSLFVSSSWLVWRNVLARFASVFFSLLRESGGKSGCFLAECFRKVFGSLARLIGKGCVGGITNPHCTRRRIEPCRGSICDRHCPGLGEGLGDLTGEFGATAVRCVKISCAWGGTGMASSAGRGGGTHHLPYFPRFSPFPLVFRPRSTLPPTP